MAFQQDGVTIIDDSANLTNIANDTAFVLNVTGNHAAGDVGSYAMLGSAANTKGAIAQGATRAGSALFPGAVTGCNGNTAPSSDNWELLHFRGTSVSGTWVACTESTATNTGDTDAYIAVWFRRV